MVSPRSGSAFLAFHISLPRVGVEGDDLAVERRHEDLARRVVHAAVHQIAARHRNGTIVLDRRVLPLDGPAFLGEVHRVDMVGVRAMHVHRRTDDQRLTLVAAQRAGGERPDLLQALDVARRDLPKRAVAGCRVVLAGHRPLIVIGLPCQQILVGRDAPRQEHRQYPRLHRCSAS